MIAVATPVGATGTSSAESMLSFLNPLPGLGQDRTFSLSVLDEAGVLFAMRSTADPQVRLFLVQPEPFFADYHPQLDEEILSTLGVDDEPPAVLVVVTPAADGSGPTANLLAPIVVNRATGVAMQAVLDGSSWPLRAPLAIV